MNMSKKKILIDTDAGLDDAQAILMAISRPDIEIVAITTTHGNTNTRQVGRNVLRLLKVANRLDIPVYPGCERSLIGDQISGTYHGQDGFGDIPASVDIPQPDESLLQTKHAAQALIEYATQHASDITLVTLGPLTNVALALRLCPDFGTKLKECVIMGGNYEGRGNQTPSAEFNFYVDPEAVRVVLEELKCQKTLIGWELCLKYAFPWEWFDEFINVDTKKAALVRAAETKNRNNPARRDNYPTPDQLAMGVCIDSRIVTGSVQVYCTVELNGHLTRGQLIVDRLNKLCKPINVHLITEIDIPSYEKLLSSALV